MSFEAVIGLEVHAQLNTRSKLFCACATTFGAPPNSQTCEVCLGLPGVLPVPNQRAVELAVRAALALECTVHCRSQWARKNYFYPDLPKGYQISQYDQPLGTGGRLLVTDADWRQTIDIQRVHLEEDAGKSIHDRRLTGSRSGVDFNRGGIPLIEIVSAPQLQRGDQAAAYLKTMRQLLRYLGVCDGNMEEGSLRCDANVSVRPVGQERLGVRTELKNINSFRFVAQAIDFEIARQTELLAAGQAILQETRLWDASAKVTRPLRTKEEEHDYRYFPDPDLPDLILPDELLRTARETMPELPHQKASRYVADLRLNEDMAEVLAADPEVATYFEETLACHANAKAIGNWIINELLGHVRDQSLATLSLRPSVLAELVALIDEGAISGKTAKELFTELLQNGGSPRELVIQRGLSQVSDEASLLAVIDRVLSTDAASVAKYRAGRTQVLSYLVGQVLKNTGGKANPKLVRDMLMRRLDGSP